MTPHHDQLPAHRIFPDSPDHTSCDFVPRVLSIAGTDPTGGAGIQADLKAIGAAGGFGMCVVTSLVAQNTQGVRSIFTPPTEFLQEQLACVFDDVEVDAVKIGMLGDKETIDAVDTWLTKHPVKTIVIDPVMIATSGDRLLAPDAEAALREFAARHATIITPNLPELAVLVDSSPARSLDAALDQAQQWARQTGRAVLAKGGHLSGRLADNALVSAEGAVTRVCVPRVETKNTHGTGCSLSSSLATRLGAGDSMADAVIWASRWLRDSIAAADELHVGQGHGPADHFHRMRRLTASASTRPWLDAAPDVEEVLARAETATTDAATNTATTEVTSAPGDVAASIVKPVIKPAGPFTAGLWQYAAEVWQQITRLPFIRDLGSGDLDAQDFAFYLNQDSHYLREYSRALAAVSNTAPTPEAQVFFAQSSAVCILTESQLHRDWLSGHTGAGAESGWPSPVTRAYTDFLRATATGDDYVVAAAAVLPCYWLYAEVGYLFPEPAADHPYRAWLETYSDEEFVKSVRQAIQLAEDALTAATPAQRKHAYQAFFYAAVHEREFFDQAYRAW